MNKILSLLFLITFASNAQVGVGTTTPAGALDITSTNDGLLIPRVALTSTTTATILTPTKSELVYNTATAGDVTPGYYYWETTPTVASDRWVRLMTTSANNDWTLTGNTGTTAGTNFIGTTDTQDLVFKTNGTERARILQGGAGSFLVNTPTATNAANTLESKASINNRAIAGYTTGTGLGIIGSNLDLTNTQGIGILGNLSSTTTSAATSNLVAVQGQVSSISATAVNALNFGGGMGLYAQTTGPTPTTAGSNAAIYGSLDQPSTGNQDVAAIIGSQSNINQGTGGYAGPLAASSNSSLAGVAGTLASKVTDSNTDSYLFGVIGDVLRDSGVATSTIPDRTGGVMGYNGSNAWGVLGYRNSSGTAFGTYSGLIAANIVGGTGKSSLSNKTPNNGIGIGTTGGFMGGFIEGEQYGLISKGDEFGLYVTGNTLTNKPIVQLSEGASNRIATYATTSTSVDVTTRGKGKLNNGETFISFDKNFIETTTISEEELNITITPMGATNGVYVSRVTSTGFFVKENLNGKSNANFSWFAIGTQKGYENGVKISNEILANDFDKKMDGVMYNEADTTGEATPIYFDGNKVKFERYNEPKENQKKAIQVKKREPAAVESEKPKQ